MRRLSPALALALALACAGPFEEPEDPVSAAEAYVGDPLARRLALERSVAAAETPYGELRLMHYSLRGAAGASIDDWDDAPVSLLRPVRRLLVGETRHDPAPAPEAAAPAFDDHAPLRTLDDYVRAGRRAFETLPVQVEIPFSRLARSARSARSFGFSVTADGEVVGAVELEGADGSWLVGLTCAACHTSVGEDGVPRPGLSEPGLDIASLLGAPIWAPGTVDVTGDGVDNPVRATDLRPLRLQSRLHHAGNLINGRIARMIRIETLIAGQSSWRERPDRRMVAAIALYLESLANDLPPPDWTAPGAGAFRVRCAGCHAGEAMSGPAITVGRLGTDPAGTQGARGTGGYRAPSLRGVSDRRGLLHDGTARDVRAVLRLDRSDHAGHAFGLDLTRATRAAIVDFLR